MTQYQTQVSTSLPLVYHLLRVFFFKINFFLQNSFTDTIRVSNSLDPDQGQHFVIPDLDPNCLHRLSAAKY